MPSNKIFINEPKDRSKFCINSGILLLFLLLPLKADALIYTDIHGQIGYGNLLEYGETYNGSQKLDHQGWTLNFGIGSRVGLSFTLLTFGIVGDYSKVQWEGEREDANIQNGFDGDEDYDNVFERTLIGGFFKVDIPALPIYAIGEYYAKVKGQTTYAESVGENPFGQGDEFRGTGFGVGAGSTFSLINFTGVFRYFTYDKYILSGVEQVIPNNRFEKQNSWEINLQVGIAIDLL